AVELITLRRHILLEALQPVFELSVTVPQRAESGVRLGANAAPHILLVLVESRPRRPRLLRQKQRHDQIADDDQRAWKEQRPEHDEHSDDRHVEAEVVGEARADSENHSLLGVAVQTVALQVLHGRILVSVMTSSMPEWPGGCRMPHVFFFHAGCWTSRIVSSVLRRLSND